MHIESTLSQTPTARLCHLAFVTSSFVKKLYYSQHHKLNPNFSLLRKLVLLHHCTIFLNLLAGKLAAISALLKLLVCFKFRLLYIGRLCLESRDTVLCLSLIRFVTKFAKRNTVYPICFSFASLARKCLRQDDGFDSYDF